MAIQIKSSSAEDLKKMQEARAQREAEKAAQGGYNNNSNGSGNGGTWTPPEGSTRRAYVQVIKGTGKTKTVTAKPGIFRFINLDVFPQKPVSMWNFHNGEARILHDAWIVDDNGKKMHLVYPYIDEDTESVYGKESNPINDWIAAVTEEQKVWKKVTDPNTGTTKNKLIKTPLYEKRNDHGNLEGTPEAEGLPTLAEIYHYIMKGGDEGQMSKGFIGNKIIACNCIDRNDMEYHRTSKKFKLFAQALIANDPTKPKYKDAGKFFLYDSLFEAVPDMSFDSDYNRVDVAVIPELATFGNNAYQAKVLDASARVKSGFFNDLKKDFDIEELKKIVVTDDYLSEEEMSWDPVDIDAVWPLTSCNAFAKRVGKMVEAWDKMMGTDFLPRMKAVADKEIAAKANDKEESTALAEETAPVEEPAPTTDEPSFDNMAPIETEPDPLDAMSQPAPQARPRPAPAATATSDELDYSNLKGYPLLTAEELALVDVDGMKAARGTPDASKYFDEAGKVKQLKFFESANPLYSCEGLGPNHDQGCGHLNPLAFTHCAFCGYDYTKEQ